MVLGRWDIFFGILKQKKVCVFCVDANQSIAGAYNVVIRNIIISKFVYAQTIGLSAGN